MANPLLESFRKPTKAFMINSSFPPANLKGKGNPDWYFQPFGMQACNPPEICKAHNQYPPHSTVHLENPPLLRIMINEQISSLT